MPHKPSPARNTTVQFVSVSLTAELKHVLANWATDNSGNIIKWLADGVQAGYRISIKEESEGYSANMSALRDTSANKGLVLMERASSPERALLRLLWAHNVHFKLIWPRDKTTTEDDW